LKLIVCVLLALALSSIARAQGQDREELLKDVTTPPADTIEGLRQQQIKVLESAAAAKRARLNAGTLPSWVVTRCYERLAHARLSATSSASERIAHAEELVSNLKSILDLTIERFEFGVDEFTHALDAKADYLEARILLLEEKQKAASKAGPKREEHPKTGARSRGQMNIELLKEPAGGTIKELRQQRIDLLTLAADAQSQSFDAGVISYVPMLASRAKLTRALLDAASDAASRVKHAEQLVATRKQAVEIDRQRYTMGFEQLEHEADYLEAKILLFEERRKLELRTDDAQSQ